MERGGEEALRGRTDLESSNGQGEGEGTDTQQAGHAELHSAEKPRARREGGAIRWAPWLPAGAGGSWAPEGTPGSQVRKTLSVAAAAKAYFTTNLI